jgi:hypothetical protein
MCFWQKSGFLSADLAGGCRYTSNEAENCLKAFLKKSINEEYSATECQYIVGW